MVVTKTLEKGKRIQGKDRERVAERFVKRYNAGDSIRKIAEANGRSFGFVHGVLKEAGVDLRSRGGDVGNGHRKSAAKKPVIKKAPAKAPAKKAPAAKKPAAKKTAAKTATPRKRSPRKKILEGATPDVVMTEEITGTNAAGDPIREPVQQQQDDVPF